MKELSIHNMLPKDAVKTPEEAIDKIRFESIEHLYVFKNGKQVGRFIGEKNRITIAQTHLTKLKDAIVVHNHPQGSSFSKEDVEAIVYYNARQFIVVTENFLYQVFRPNTGWDIDFSNDITVQRFEESEILADNSIMKLISNNDMKLYEKEVEKVHYIWASFFQFNDIKYVRKKLT